MMHVDEVEIQEVLTPLQGPSSSDESHAIYATDVVFCTCVGGRGDAEWV